MGIQEAVLSGLIQGFTEFLPVSSSGHLVLAHAFFGLVEPYLFFDVCLHFATMFSVVIFFRREIAVLFTGSGRVLRKCIVIGSVPAVIAGLFLEKYVSDLFANPRIVSLMLIVTAGVLIFAQMVLSDEVRKKSEIGPKNAFFVGLAQAAAIVPGISRSGLTITAGLAAGMRAKDAFIFSFLLSIPVIVGATLYKGLSLILSGEYRIEPDIKVFTAGMLCAFLSGIVGLLFLKRVVLSRRIWVFSVYCLLVGSVGLVVWG